MRRVFNVLAVLVGLGVLYVAVHLSLIEIGQEIVVLHKPTGDGSITTARLWIVDEGEASWLHHGYADDAWIQQIGIAPIVTIERGGETSRFRAKADPAADPKVHRLLRKKYGLADRLVRFWAGTDIDTGVVTGSRCKAVPVRLESL